MTTCARCHNDLPKGHASQLCRTCIQEAREEMYEEVRIALAAGLCPLCEYPLTDEDKQKRHRACRPCRQKHLHKVTKDWDPRAACRDKDPDLFHTELFSTQKRNPLSSHTVRVAKSICAGCPVRRPCLMDALAFEAVSKKPRPGIWGGSLPSERQQATGTTTERCEVLLEAMAEQAEKHGLKGAA